MRTKKVTLFLTPSFRRMVEEKSRMGIVQMMFDLGPALREIGRFQSLINTLCIFESMLALNIKGLRSFVQSQAFRNFGPTAEISPFEERLIQEIETVFQSPAVVDKFRRTIRVEILVSYCPPSETGFTADTIKIKTFFYERAQDALTLIDLDLKAVDGSILVCTITLSI